MFLVSSCSCLCPIHWSQMSSWEWRCSWSSADMRCSSYIWAINNFIAYQGATYIGDFTVFAITDATILQPRPVSGVIINNTNSEFESLTLWNNSFFFYLWHHDVVTVVRTYDVAKGHVLEYPLCWCHQVMTRHAHVIKTENIFMDWYKKT